jgi:hypothetical protein
MPWVKSWLAFCDSEGIQLLEFVKREIKVKQSLYAGLSRPLGLQEAESVDT